MRKIIFFVVLVVFLFFNLNSEIKYKVSGKVLQNNQPVKNYYIRIVGKTNIKKRKRRIEKDLFPNKKGEYSAYLPNGEYYITCDFIKLPETEDKFFVSPIGPEKFCVNNKNIDGIDFTIYKDSEIIEANISILNNIPQTTPTVNYRWGRVPLYPEEKCREFAKSTMWDIVIELPSDIRANLKLGEPVVYFDFKNNPIFYEYPIVYTNLNVEVAYFGVQALGIKPTQGSSFNIMDIESKADPELKRYRGIPFTTDGLIPRVIENLAHKRGIDKADIIVDKLIFYYGFANILFKIKSTGELVLASSPLRLNSVSNKGLLFMQKLTEIYGTLQYIIDYKRKMNIPLMEKK